jgi:hypothetical protein
MARERKPLCMILRKPKGAWAATLLIGLVALVVSVAVLWMTTWHRAIANEDSLPLAVTTTTTIRTSPVTDPLPALQPSTAAGVPPTAVSQPKSKMWSSPGTFHARQKFPVQRQRLPVCLPLAPSKGPLDWKAANATDPRSIVPLPLFWWCLQMKWRSEWLPKTPYNAVALQPSTAAWVPQTAVSQPKSKMWGNTGTFHARQKFPIQRQHLPVCLPLAPSKGPLDWKAAKATDPRSIVPLPLFWWCLQMKWRSEWLPKTPYNAVALQPSTAASQPKSKMKSSPVTSCMRQKFQVQLQRLSLCLPLTDWVWAMNWLATGIALLVSFACGWHVLHRTATRTMLQRKAQCMGVTTIARVYRGHVARVLYRSTRLSIVNCQSVARRWLAQRVTRRCYAAIHCLQRAARCRQARDGDYVPDESGDFAGSMDDDTCVESSDPPTALDLTLVADPVLPPVNPPIREVAKRQAGQVNDKYNLPFGVTYHKARDKYQAQIYHPESNGTVYLGLFDDKDAALAACGFGTDALKKDPNIAKDHLQNYVELCVSQMQL